MAGDGDPMGLAESFLQLLTENAVLFGRVGVPAYELMRTLRAALDAYRRAERAGDPKAIAAAKARVDAWMRRNLPGVAAIIASPSPGEMAG